MKTIEQGRFSKIEIHEDHAGHFLEQNHYHIRLEKDSDAIPQLIQALLPEGKAIIDVPEGYEVESQSDVMVAEMSLESGSMQVNLLRTKVQEPFIWPEHLPDGITEIRKIGGEWHFGSSPAEKMIPLAYYNRIARPEDRITIPDWLVKEPRTLIKGEK